jgi:hypothetical protein
MTNEEAAFAEEERRGVRAEDERMSECEKGSHEWNGKRSGLNLRRSRSGRIKKGSFRIPDKLIRCMTTRSVSLLVIQ